MKILMQQRCGLGNQLFQYAAGLYFAKRLGAELEIIRAPEGRSTPGDHPRLDLISNFSISAPVRDRSRRDRLMRKVVARYGLLRRAFGMDIYSQPVRDIWTFQPGIPVRSGTRNFYIEGGWEAHQYVQAVEDELRKELVLTETPSARNAETLRQIQEATIPVSLHVRHGDYATFNSGKDVLPLSYQRNAIEIIRQSLSNPTFFVFSDDIAYARENIPDPGRMIFVDHNDQENAHQDLRLMSACHHHIIANSTFSWWGAWLNPRRDKLVLAPDRWKDLDFPDSDIIPPDWRRIAVERHPGF